jgi:hypothetical protein
MLHSQLQVDVRIPRLAIQDFPDLPAGPANLMKHDLLIRESFLYP